MRIYNQYLSIKEMLFMWKLKYSKENYNDLTLVKNQTLHVLAFMSALVLITHIIITLHHSMPYHIQHLGGMFYKEKKVFS